MFIPNNERRRAICNRVRHKSYYNTNLDIEIPTLFCPEIIHVEPSVDPSFWVGSCYSCNRRIGKKTKDLLV